MGGSFKKINFGRWISFADPSFFAVRCYPYFSKVNARLQRLQGSWIR